MNSAEKRQIVKCITNKIKVDRGEISIDLFYLPSLKRMTEGWWSLGLGDYPRRARRGSASELRRKDALPRRAVEPRFESFAVQNSTIRDGGA